MFTIKPKIVRVLFLFLFFVPCTGYSQNFPVYNLNIYDSTVTGYYFLTTYNLGTPVPGNVPMQLVLNTGGEVVYYNPFPNGPSSVDFKVQPNGKMSYYRGNKYFLLDSTFTIIDSVSCTGYFTDLHDLQILNNNHYLLMGIQDSTMDLSAYNYFNHNGSPGSQNANVTANLIQELDSNKNVVFEWHSLSHFQFDDVDEFWLDSPNNVDWTHSNAIEMDTDGNILLSSRHFNEITKIDHATGNIIWRLGGKENEFTFINDSLIFRGQHDIRRIANGNITLFDNGHYTNPHGARGVEYALDEVNKTATLVWSYTHDPSLVSYATGNNQRVSGSRKLINYGNRSFGDLCFALVDSLNNPVSELLFTDSSATYRAFFYPSLPWSINRPQLNCYQQGTGFFLTTSVPFNSYKWSTGATTSSIQVTVPGTYYVYVPYGEGFIKSGIFEVINMTNPCSTTSINETEKYTGSISVYPNPSTSFLSIHYPVTGEKNDELNVADITGKVIFKSILPATGNYNLETKNFENGIYFFRIGSLTGKFIKN